MHHFQTFSNTGTRKNTIDDGSLSTYVPPRIVISSLISRKDLCNNAEETETQKIDKLTEVDDLFPNLSEQMQDKIKRYREDNDYPKLKPPSKKRKNFVSEFLQVKKRFEAEFTANTRIYPSSSQRLINSETIGDLNSEEYKLQMNSADKYVTMINSHKNGQRDSLIKAANKYYSSQHRNWVPGAVMTKIKVNSNFNSSGSAYSIENKALLNKNSVINNQETKIREREQNGTFYTFTYTAATAGKKAKNKKKSFIQEFSELRDKLVVIPNRKIKNREENSHLLNAEINKGEASDSTPIRKQESGQINDRIITPFRSFKTSFFSNFNSSETANSEKRLNEKQDNLKHDVTASWVKGGIIKRKENMTHNFINSKNREQTPEKMYVPKDLCCNAFPSYFFQSNMSHEEKTDLNFTRKNNYSKVSPKYTSVADESRDGAQNECLFQKECTSAITMSNTSVQYSRKTMMRGPKVVITQMKVTKLTLFPSNQVNLFL